MKDSFLSCKLIGPQQIKAMLFGPLNKEEKHPFLLVTDHKKIETLRIEKVTPVTGGWTFDLRSYSELELGHQYDIVLEGFTRSALDIGNAIYFPDFDDKYTYNGNDLGARISEFNTTFKLWAPLASNVILKLVVDHSERLIAMTRSNQGIFETSLAGNLDGATYVYLVTNNGLTVEATDPYAFGSTLNGEMSVVVDFAKLDVPLYQDELPKFGKYTDAIIYETSVRDITSDPLTNIKHKGRFLGMIESGVKTEKGHPVGFDYLTSLGITHLQLLPIYDFQTVDERDPGRFYNWGYDPQQYFVPDGSFASDLSDPYSRIKDLKALVSAYHKQGIRIVMDVVYNHVYHAHLSVFEKIVPSYYFRRRKDGRLSNGSFCGNDVASERPMVRKLILDSAVHWVQTYGIDGFRFDLMSNIDLTTSKLLEKTIKAIKPDFMFYGEGWNMPTELKEEDRSSMYNCDKLPNYAFFNDSFRDIVKGATMDDKLKERGYLLGASSYRLGFKFAWVGSCLDLIFPAKFKHAHQSINYVECHDNGTLFDKMLVSNGQEPLAVRLKRLKLINAATMFAFGIPFFHMGQEIGLSKGGDLNSYKSGDKVNRYDYRVLDERYDLYEYFKDLARLRRDLPFLRLDKANLIEKMTRFDDLDESGIIIHYADIKALAPYKRFFIMINPSMEDHYYQLDEYMLLVFSDKGYVANRNVKMKDIMIEALSLLIFAI
ncbi:MAG TPA: type I pullulanase [Bacilli bacterium]|nr:type I pullulanase [Bacilli bacterium]